MEEYALVTGAGSGLGMAFARELARRKYNLILVSLPCEGLKQLSQSLIEEYKIDVKYFEADLAEKDEVLALAEEINTLFQVFMLINNAGVGGTKKFADADADYLTNIIQVNVMATALLTHQLLPNLLGREKAYILNVSSMAAFSPIGFKTVYPASKSFVHSFSRGLYEELKETNIFVSVVNPGAMATNKDVTARIKKQGFFGRLTLLKPEKVARICIDRIFQRDSVIMVNPLGWLVLQLLPIWIRLPIMTNVIRKELEK